MLGLGLGLVRVRVIRRGACRVVRGRGPADRVAAPPCGRLLQSERSSCSIVTSGSASKPSKPAKAAASSSAAVGLGLGIGFGFGFASVCPGERLGSLGLLRQHVGPRRCRAGSGRRSWAPGRRRSAAARAGAEAGAGGARRMVELGAATPLTAALRVTVGWG